MQKNPHAVALGRKGGRKGGAARAAKLSAEQRSASARHAVLARWKRPVPVSANRPASPGEAIGFFENLTLEELARRQGWQPSRDPDRLAGALPDDLDVEAMVADIYRQRRRRR